MDVPSVTRFVLVPSDRLQMLAGLGRFTLAKDTPEQDRAWMVMALDEIERWLGGAA